MCKLLVLTDRYLATLDWKKFSLLKVCCIAFGTAIGAFLPEKYRKVAISVASAVFVLTYIPLMADFLKSTKRLEDEMYVI